MQIADYQAEAQATDQKPGDDSVGLVVPLLGLAGESGSLLASYKKFLRDGPAHRLYKEEVAEELGDILWYVANLASKFDLRLEEIAAANLAKTQSRWPPAVNQPALFPRPLLDESFPENEQFPRDFRAEIRQVEGGRRIELTVDGRKIGNELTDNAHVDDGYRFHDVLHLANVAILGWSPTMRSLMRRKRRSVPAVDEVEDGGRAIVIDEGVIAYVFDYARRHNFLDGVEGVDYNLLKTVRSLTSGLEVSQRSAHEWERAILDGYSAWRTVRQRGGGVIRVNLVAGTVFVES